MAKLPDIKYGNRVSPLASTAVARLPGKMQNARETTAAVRGLGDAVSDMGATIQKSLDEEAELDATRRFQTAQRDYMTSAQKVAQSYHSDRSKSLEDYQSDIEQARSESFTTATKGASGRVVKRLGPKLDNYRTGITGAEVKAFAALVESRKLMDIADIQDKATETFQANPAHFDESMGVVETAWDVSGLPAPVVEKSKREFTDASMATAISRQLDRGNVAGAVRLQQSEYYDQLPEGAKAELDAAVQKASLETLDVFTRSLSNDMLMGNLTLDLGLDAVRTQVDALTNLTGTRADDAVEMVQGDLVDQYLTGQLFEGNFDEVLGTLKAGTYSHLLDPKATARLRKQAQAGTSSGNTDMYINYLRQPMIRTVKDTLAAAEADPLLAEQHYTAARRAALELATTYIEAGKTVPAEVVAMQEDLNRAQTRAGIVSTYTWGDPVVTAQTAYSDLADPSPEQILNREAALDARHRRAEALATDAISFNRKGGAVLPQLPNIDQPEFFEQAAARYNHWQMLRLRDGEGISGMFDGLEGERLYTQLKSLSTDDMFKFGAALDKALGSETAYQLWDQLIPDTEQVGSIPLAMRLSSLGLQDIAERTLLGQTLRDKKQVTYQDSSRVENHVREALGGAYGNTYMIGGEYVRNANINAIKSLYTYKLSQSGESLEYNDDLLDEAVEEITGGVFSYGGEDYVSPRHGTTERQFIQWQKSLGANDLPDFYDGKGSAIDAEEVARGLRGRGSLTARYMLIDSGTPGQYFVQDLYGNSSGIVPGAFLPDKDGNEAVVSFSARGIGQ